MAPVPVPDAKKKHLILALSLAIPAVSFAGIGLAVLLQSAGLIPDAGGFFWGSVAGGFMLGYLAYLEPRRDIVSLLAPLYAIIIFVVPLETKPTLLLQVLFALSITILVVRLHFRFSTRKITPSEGDGMEKFLYDYMHRITPFFMQIDPATAHEIASAVLSFKFGLYQKTVTSADRAISRLAGGQPVQALVRALQIARDRARNLDEGAINRYSPVSFEAGDAAYLAVILPPEKISDHDSYVLDNALLLLYAVAYLESPDDGQPLDEHQNYVIQILELYREPLGMQ